MIGTHPAVWTEGIAKSVLLHAVLAAKHVNHANVNLSRSCGRLSKSNVERTHCQTWNPLHLHFAVFKSKAGGSSLRCQAF